MYLKKSQKIFPYYRGFRFTKVSSYLGFTVYSLQMMACYCVKYNKKKKYNENLKKY